MIAVDDTGPRWLRELDRYIALKSLLFVHGNTLDLVSYPVRKPGSAETYWVESSLTAFFQRYLVGLGYQVIGFLDPVDGLVFQDGNAGEMQDAYDDLVSGRGAGGRGAPPAERGCPAGSRVRQPVDTGEAIDGIRVVLANQEVPCAFVINFSSRMLSSPVQLPRDQRILFTKILKASLETSIVYTGDRQLGNVLVFVCDKLNDLPPFLYLNNTRTRSIFVDKPDTLERARFIGRSYRAFYSEDGDHAEPGPGFVADFASLTEGLSHHELKSLARLSNVEKLPLEKIKDICERYKYGINESEWDKLDRTKLAGLEKDLRERIKGQDIAIARVMDIIKRAKIGLAAGHDGKRGRPRGVLFFAGPTGVGKTEVAKIMAERIFGSQDRLLRFDMSEYGAEHADQKLLGSPPGYVGYEEGGQLTNAVRENPFSILLFDEIDKAHGNIFDKFLQVLDDGRLTDNQGETVYFSESIIIFTSNIGIEPRRDGDEEGGRLDPETTSYAEMRAGITRSIRDFFNIELGRPEILNRFGDNFVVFDFIRPPADRDIVEILVRMLVASARDERNISLQVEEAVVDQLAAMGKEYLGHGGRGLRNMIDSALVNPLNRALFDRDIRGGNARVTGLTDNGPGAPYRFEVEVATS